jgi:hypothetical protein
VLRRAALGFPFLIPLKLIQAGGRVEAARVRARARRNSLYRTVHCTRRYHGSTGGHCGHCGHLTEAVIPDQVATCTADPNRKAG